MLYVRNPDSYVLVRRFPDGRPFITGSDGERGWSVRPDGAVRVSGDPLRFRGPLPGNQYGIDYMWVTTGIGYALVALLGFGNHEFTVHFGNFRIKPGIDGDAVEAFDLIVLTLGVFGRESGVGFEHADLRGGLEPLGQ